VNLAQISLAPAIRHVALSLVWDGEKLHQRRDQFSAGRLAIDRRRLLLKACIGREVVPQHRLIAM
jgi:hypothetical protein